MHWNFVSLKNSWTIVLFLWSSNEHYATYSAVFNLFSNFNACNYTLVYNWYTIDIDCYTLDTNQEDLDQEIVTTKLLYHHKRDSEHLNFFWFSWRLKLVSHRIEENYTFSCTERYIELIFSKAKRWTKKFYSFFFRFIFSDSITLYLIISPVTNHPVNRYETFQVTWLF